MKKYICLGLLCLIILCGCHSSSMNTLTIQNKTTTPFYGLHIRCITHHQTIEDHIMTKADQSCLDSQTIIIDKSDFNDYQDIKVYAIISNQEEIKIHQSSLLLQNISKISLEGNRSDGFFFIDTNH